MKENNVIVEEKGDDLMALSSAEGIQDKVFDLIEELCLVSVRDTKMKLIEDLAMDSLRMVMLLVSLEDVFEIELDESDMNPFALITVGDVVALAMKYVGSPKEESNDE